MKRYNSVHKLVSMALVFVLCLSGCQGNQLVKNENEGSGSGDIIQDGEAGGEEKGSGTGALERDGMEEAADGKLNGDGTEGTFASGTSGSNMDSTSDDRGSIGGVGNSVGMPVITASQISELPAGSWQAEAVFPDWRGYVDDTLALNSMVSFEGYHEQGTFYLCPSAAVTGYQVYVNGSKLDTTTLTGGGVYAVDYSEAAKDGRNTVQITGIEPYDGEDVFVRVCVPYPVVLDGTLAEAGLAEESLELISDIIASDIEYGFPSAQLAIVKDGRLVYENAWGTVNAYLPDGSKNGSSAPVTTDTLYDLASVTKMFSVNYALQKLLTDGAISLDERIVDYLGAGFSEDTLDFDYETGINPGIETQKQWKAELTIRDLLYHQGGFPADPRYFNPYMNTARQAYDPNMENLLYAGNDGSKATREATIEAICKTPLLYEPGTKTLYSDVDYMILGVVVEQVTGKDLDTYLKDTFYTPMGLSHITYNPLQHGFQPDDCAATELNGNTRDGYVTFPGVRTYTLQGEVHDEKAYYSMGGVSGHAGLFANAGDLAKLASVMLTGGYGNQRYFSRNVMDIFTAPKSETAGGWGLGWWREGDSDRVWYFGTQAGSDTIGHQGWTGTLVMIDPERDMVMVYLTNKINSPVTNGRANPNKFDGNWYTASTLGFVPQMLSIGMEERGDVSEQLLMLSADMANESIKLVKNAGVKTRSHPVVQNAESKIEVFRTYAEASGDEEAVRLADILKGRLTKMLE